VNVRVSRALGAVFECINPPGITSKRELSVNRAVNNEIRGNRYGK
jgi:hypothetical protein